MATHREEFLEQLTSSAQAYLNELRDEYGFDLDEPHPNETPAGRIEDFLGYMLSETERPGTLRDLYRRENLDFNMGMVPTMSYKDSNDL